MPDHTIADLAAKRGARFTFHCRPCNWFAAFSGEDLLAKVGGEIKFVRLKERTRCRYCKMPVDGDFRTFDYVNTAYLADLKAKGIGTGDGGWSGPR